MKRLIYLCLIGIITFSITGCNKEIPNIQETVSTTATTPIETQPPSTAEVYIPKTYSEFRTYNNGLAWTEYTDNDGIEYYGCIDEKGKMLFRYKSDNLEILSDYENNYSYLKSKNGTTIYVIDKNGDVCNSYNNAVAYGYGYTVLEDHHSDFDSEYYEYSIYDPDNNLINTTKFDNEVNVKYCGDGVFDFGSKLFFSQNEKMIDYSYERSKNDKDVQFNNGIAYIENDALAIRSSYVTINSTGTIVDLENVDDILDEKVQNTEIYSDSLLVYEEDTPKLATYNVDTQSVTYLKDQSILEKLETHYDGNISSLDISPLLNENGMILRLVGEDGYGYVIISDYEFNFKTEPMKYDECKIYKNGICEIDSVVYDMEGNQLFSLFDYEEVISDSENILLVCCKNSDVTTDRDYYDDPHDNLEKSNFVALDKDGNLLFNGIDSQNVIHKNL